MLSSKMNAQGLFFIKGYFFYLGWEDDGKFKRTDEPQLWCNDTLNLTLKILGEVNPSKSEAQ